MSWKRRNQESVWCVQMYNQVLESSYTYRTLYRSPEHAEVRIRRLKARLFADEQVIFSVRELFLNPTAKRAH